ncbi:LAGLIDADG family homing endonuclease [Candidatus Parcubacteria bacterium]|nr:LAGLIDADG family homing endonuclease [Candidatus Parcubacteria bacterium]
MPKEKFDIINVASSDGCFDLQFRRDTRHERTGSPTYYRWKIQFIITMPKEQTAVLKKAKQMIGSGAISLAKNQARYSVQKLEDLAEVVIPFFKKNTLTGDKKRCFDIWQKAVAIVHQNKGKKINDWKKNDLLQLIEIHKSLAKYKTKPKKQKWIEMAKTLSKA